MGRSDSIGWRTVGSIEFVDAFPATADAKRGVVYVRRDTLAAMALGVTTAAVRESVTTAAASTEGTSYKGVYYNIYNVPNVAIGDMFFDPDEAEYRAGENKLYDGSLQLVVNSQPSADDANVGNLRTVFGSSSEWVGRARDGTILITSDASHPCIGQFDNEAQVAQALQSVASQVQSGKNYYYFDRGLNQLRYVSAFTAMSAEVLGLRNFPSTGGEGGAGGVGGAGASQASAIAYAQVANNASAPAIGSPAYNGTAWTVATGWSLTEPTPSTTTDIFALVLQATPPGEGESAWNVVNFGAQRIYAGTTQGNFAFQYSIDVGVTWTIAKPTNFGMGEGHYVRVLGSNGQWSPPIYSGHATALQWFIGEFETTGTVPQLTIWNGFQPSQWDYLAVQMTTIANANDNVQGRSPIAMYPLVDGIPSLPFNTSAKDTADPAYTFYAAVKGFGAEDFGFGYIFSHQFGFDASTWGNMWFRFQFVHSAGTPPHISGINLLSANGVPTGSRVKFKFWLVRL